MPTENEKKKHGRGDLEREMKTLAEEEKLTSIVDVFLQEPWSLYKAVLLLSKLVAICFSIFQIITALTVPLTALLQRSIHLGFAAALVFLPPISDKERGVVKKLFDLVFLVLGVASMVYMMLNYNDLSHRIGSLNTIDVLFAWLAIIMVLEGTRRTMGLAMPLVAAICLLYCLFGMYLPGSWGHRGYSLSRIANTLYLGTDGIFGTPLGVSAKVVAVFIIFGVLLEKSGAGDFIIKCATSLLGTVRGGPAKVAIVASGFFGTISGSVVANVVGTGSFTIPMMKRSGFDSDFAGAVEACASTGGMIMPPIMGTVAFLIADNLGIPYWDVVVAAFIPAVLYYIALFCAVDFKAASAGLHGVPRSELPKLGPVLKSGWIFLLPIIVLIYCIGPIALSAQRAGVYSCLTILAIIIIKKQFTFKKLLVILEAGGKGIVGVAMAMACAGIVIGAFSLTGLGLKLSSLLVQSAGNNLMLLLILTVISCVILGMGVSCTAAYIILAVLVVPALTEMGVNELAAHMFVFYYGSMANITPPVALGSYAAASIAGGSSLRTGFVGMRMVIPSMIVPFMFVFNNALLCQGTFLEIIRPFLTACLGVALLAAGLQGFLLHKLSWWKRSLCCIAGVGMIMPDIYTDFIGVAIAVLIVATEIMQRRSDHTKQGGAA